LASSIISQRESLLIDLRTSENFFVMEEFSVDSIWNVRFKSRVGDVILGQFSIEENPSCYVDLFWPTCLLKHGVIDDTIKSFILRRGGVDYFYVIDGSIWLVLKV
ncbi:MAG: hypothetical protein WCT18_04540, partial [Patescibacteria group bacterium]